MKFTFRKLLISFILAAIFPTGAAAQKVHIVAHRGYWNCEEAGFARNSVAALRA